MTRINAGISPVALADWHLIAEIEEMVRIADVYQYRIDNGQSFNDLPRSYTLGKGHVKFFLNKGLFVQKRYAALLEEYRKRKFRLKANYPIVDNTERFNIFAPEHLNDWTPSAKDNGIVAARIIHRLFESTHNPQYYGLIITKESAADLIKKVATPYEDPQLKLL